MFFPISAGKLEMEYFNWLAGDREVRFGKYLCNRYLPNPKERSDLYYEKDDSRVYNIVMVEVW